jgi:alkaline phosphatase
MKEQGKETGIVVSSYVTHATPASFYAKVPHRKQYEDIAVQMAENPYLNLIIGGGMKHFNQRKDSINLVERMENELGWKVYDTLADIDVTCKKYAVMANADHMPPAAERGDFLPRAVKTALKTLDNAENGFFLMVEGSQIDFACHGNDSTWMMDEMLDFDYAIKVALDYAKEKGNTLVVVTADHETGGLTLPDPQGKYTNVVFDYSTGSHTCLPVLVYAYGPGAERFTGWMQNNELKAKIMNACGMENISDSIPKEPKKRFKAVKANLDSNSNN